MTASLSKPENELTVAMKESHRTSRWSPWRNGSLNSLRGFRKTSCSSGARPYELRIKTDRQNRISANNQAVQYSVRTSHPPRSWEPHPRKTAWYPKLESCCGGQSRWNRAIRTLQGPGRQNGMVVRTWTGPIQPCSPPSFGVWAHLAKSFQPGV